MICAPIDWRPVSNIVGLLGARMIRTSIVAFAALTLLGGCASVATQPSASTARQAGLAGETCSSVRSVWASSLDFGSLSERECPLRVIRSATSGVDGHGGFHEVRRGVQLLHGAYNRRAKRQQLFLDAGAGITVGSAAAGLEGGLSASTRQAWGIAAFAPVAISQFNAYEPTRELFHGGALALQLITSRYDRLHEALTLAKGASSDPDCGAIANLIDELAPRQGSGPLARHDTEGVLLVEARRLQQDCQTLAENHRGLVFAATYADQIADYLAAEYAADVLELDHALLAKDRDLRYTPMESLGAVAASPLRTIDSLLTGDDTQGALDAMKTQIAFSGLNHNLAAIRLPPLPSRAPAISGLSAVAESIDDTGAIARRNATGPYVARLRAIAQTLQGLQTRQEFALALAGEYGLAANADYLTFAYDAVTNTTVITLAPRPTEPAALGSASTGSASSAPPMVQ